MSEDRKGEGALLTLLNDPSRRRPPVSQIHTDGTGTTTQRVGAPASTA